MSNQNNKTLSVDELTSLLLKRRIITPAFRWPIIQDCAERLLKAAYIGEVRINNMEFVDDKATELNIHNVAEALRNLGKPKFGITLCGACGNGKSTMMQAVWRASVFLRDKGFFNYRTPKGYANTLNVDFIFRNATSLAAGEDVYENINDCSSEDILVLEDIGQEPIEVQNYGNIIYPVMMTLERRYDTRRTTFLTTNLSPEQLGSRYGRRIQDRLREMMFTIPFDNPSYRH